MADNINTQGMTAKLVSVIVAIVVFACVLVPICNEMINGNGGNSDGPSNVYTNTGDYYYSVPDNADHTLIVNMVIGSGGSSAQITVMSDNTTVFTNYLDMNDLSTLTGNILAVAEIDNMEYVLLLYEGLIWYSPENTSGRNLILADEQTENSAKFILPIHNGVISWKSTMIEGTTSGTVKFFISSDGEYVLSNTPVKMPTDMSVYTVGDKCIEDSEHDIVYPTLLIGKSTTADLLTNQSMPVRVIHPSEQYMGTATAQISSEQDIATLSSLNTEIEATVDEYTLTDTVSSSIIVPKTVIIDSGDSGDEPTESNMNGTVKTLIGLIPILVALSLLIGIIGLLYIRSEY